MTAKPKKLLALTVAAVFLVFFAYTPAAEASWGAAIFQEKESIADSTPREQDTRNESTSTGYNWEHRSVNNTGGETEYSIYDYLKNKRLRFSMPYTYYSAPPEPEQQQPQQPDQPQQPAQPEVPEEEDNDAPREDSDQDYSADEESREMLRMINEERTSRGIQPLQFHQELNELARKKSKDMVENDYFSHTSPNLGSFSAMVYEAGIPFRQVGENLAMTSTVQKAHTLLMSSEGHRENILNSNFTHIGIGVEYNQYGVVVTQLFIAQ